MRRNWRGPDSPADSKIFLRSVRMAQSGTPTQRSVRCKVRMTAGRSISDPQKIVNPFENFLARGKAAFSRFYASTQESLFRPSLLTRDRSNAHVVWAKWTPSVATAAARCNGRCRHALIHDQNALRENFGGTEHSIVA